MAAPKKFDDEFLLCTTAEILAFPEFMGVRTIDQAIREAIAYIKGSDSWPARKHEQAVERIRKAYGARKGALESEARSRPRLFGYGPRLPPCLLLMPEDPETLHARREGCELAAGLRYVAQWAIELAGILDQQNRNDAVHPKLREHAKQLIQMVKKEEAERANCLGKNADD